jgi:oligoendopeptidase F
MQEAGAFFNRLNRNYMAVHSAKENLFWSTYMGTSDDQAGFAAAEKRYKQFISDSARLRAVGRHLATAEATPDGPGKAALIHGLKGWRQFFECNVIADPTAQQLGEDLIEMESDLFARRKTLTLTHIDESGRRVPASLGSASANLLANPDAEARRTSHQALLELEEWVLTHGFLDLVRQRNRFARAMGADNFFDYKVVKEEGLTSAALFAILDDFEARTRAAQNEGYTLLRKRWGDDALAAHNLRFAIGGDVSRQLDPYLPFAQSLRRWTHSFGRLGIEFKGATLTLDLLDRHGKYENGFMHAPRPCYFEGETWHPAIINLTSLARPDQVGSGAMGLHTLFHEGGHAAHFANITQNAPCFSQEYPPTSMAYAETQSMFCDSLTGDADWLKAYARDNTGEVPPDSLIRAQLEATQPFRAYGERSILVVPYFERALYRLSDDALTADTVRDLARRTEQKILALETGPRPLLAIPHLLNQESACAYHGYLLAHMAVYQTRDYLAEKLGYLCDNPAVGRLLSQHYWAPGNSVNHSDTIRALTGQAFSATALAAVCNQSVAEAWQEAQAKIDTQAKRPSQHTEPPALNAKIRVVHGSATIADNEVSDEKLCADFEAWIKDHYPAADEAAAAPVHK